MNVLNMLFGSKETPVSATWETTEVVQNVPAEPTTIDAVCYSPDKGWYLPLKQEHPAHGNRMIVLDKTGGHNAYVFKNGSWVSW